MNFQLSFQFTESFMVETMKRYRRQSRSRWFQLGARILIVPFLLFTAAVAFSHGEVALPAVMVGSALVIVFSRRLDNWFLLRRFRKSPYHNEHITMQVADGGIEMTSSKSQSKLTWAAYTRAVRFQDGLLLFQGPRMVNWLPFSALAGAATAEPLVRLVGAKISAFQNCGSVAPLAPAADAVV